MSMYPMPKYQSGQPVFRDDAGKGKILEGANAGLWFERFFQYPENNWSLEDPAVKNDWLDKYFGDVTTGKVGSETLLNRTAKRQLKFIAAFGENKGRSHVFDLNNAFMTGMGNPHPVENGLNWHPTLGVPYLSGAAVKGLVRAYLENNLDVDDGVRKDLLFKLFGSNYKFPVDKENKSYPDYEAQAGELIFFDAFPVAAIQMKLEIMTPHMGKWYEQGHDIDDLSQSEKVPADWHDPIPIKYLAVSDASYLFSFAQRGKSADIPLKQISAVLKAALDYAGAGAKTSLGYGRFSENVTHRDGLLAELDAEKRAEEQAQKHEAALVGVSDIGRKFIESSREGQWEDNKNAFTPGLIEDWLDELDAMGEPDTTVLNALGELLRKHFGAVLVDPDKKGKKGKPAHKERQRKFAHRFLDLQQKDKG